jgi:Cd2+/Zn2+-exporting ATPase
VVLAFVPPIFAGNLSEWIYRALNFLVVSCPCALVISVPLGFFGGIGGAAKQGILMKGSNYLETLANTGTFVFDKTGTLTKGNFKVTALTPVGITETDLLKYTAMAESRSSHPIAVSIVEEYKKVCAFLNDTPSSSLVAEVEELAGFGVRALVEEKEICAGNLRLMKEKNIALPKDLAELTTGTAVYVAVDGHFAGIIRIEDEIKPDAKEAMTTLKNSGIKKLVMLTGDKKATGEAIASRLGLDEVHTELLPADKVTHLETLLEQQATGHTLAYVGDGINDAPVLARADIGIAMGGLGSDAAIEAADIVIMTDEPSKLPTAIRIAKGTMNIVRQNIVFALGIKVLVLFLSALGYSNMWMAIFADVGVCVLAVLNSMRALRLK